MLLTANDQLPPNTTFVVNAETKRNISSQVAALSKFSQPPQFRYIEISLMFLFLTSQILIILKKYLLIPFTSS